MYSRKRAIGLFLSLSLVVVLLTVASTAGGAASRSSADTVNIGFVTTLSAPGDYRGGQSVLRTGKLWESYINKTGGIGGRKVKLWVYDDSGKPEVGSSLARRAIVEHKVSALLGMWHSSVTLAQTEVAKRYNVPMFATYSWADPITEKNYPQVFRIGPYNSYLGGAIVPFLKHMGAKSAAVIAEDNDYGAGEAKAIQEAAKGTGIKIEVVQYQQDRTDLSPELSRLAQESSQPDFIIPAGTLAGAYLVYNQAKEAGLRSKFLAGSDYVAYGDFWKIAKDNGVGVYYPTFYAKSLSLTPTGQQFRTLFVKQYKKPPVIVEYLVWDALTAVKSAILKSGSTEPGTLVKTLPSLRFQGTTGIISFTRKPGTVHYNQWEGLQTFFKQYTQVNQTDAGSKTVWVYRGKAK